MFTGIIQETGVLEKRTAGSQGTEFAVTARDTSRRVNPGDSVSVNGVCQTVETVTGDTITFTAVGETLRRTTLGSVYAPVIVNLERAATPETALGGHIVQGHVDGVGRVATFQEIRRGSDAVDRVLTISLPDGLRAGVVEKGSIAIDGVSLTVAGVTPDGMVNVAIVPYTLQRTIVGNYQSGTPVNIETDIVGKYVRHYMARVYGAEPNPVTGAEKASRGHIAGR